MKRKAKVERPNQGKANRPPKGNEARRDRDKERRPVEGRTARPAGGRSKRPTKGERARPAHGGAASPSKASVAVDLDSAVKAPTGAVRPVVTDRPVKPKANKSASLCFFYYGDSYVTTLFHETVKVKKAMEGYNRKVLLKEEKAPSFLDLAEKDEKLADIKDLPTKENLFKYLIQLTKDGYYIDLFCWVHGYPLKFSAMKKGKNSDKDWVTEEDILTELSPEKTGFTHIPIRIVWGTNCHGQTLEKTWRSIGAKATAASRYVNFKPISFGPFADAWNKGDVSFDKAVADSDTGWVNTKTHAYITAHAMSCRKVWGGLPFGKTVLGDHEDVKKYYKRWRGKNGNGSWSGWLGSDEWQANKSGKENMDYSSYMFRGGEKSLTKNCKPVW